MHDPLLWTLIALQIAMGGFDTLYHHEGTERLAWRPSQRRELQLHAVRNLFYALIFLVLGWAEPQGAWAIALMAVLAAEIGITLWDFVEEDLSRRLPATERVTHTLLALNYGAILVLAVPVLLDWAARPTAVFAANHGYWSLMATGAALAVGLFGLRDMAAARRSDRLTPPEAARLAAALPPRQRVLVTGGTGFVGARLVEALVGAGHLVTVLTRDTAKAAALPHPLRIVTTLDRIPDDEGFDAIVNLAGEPIADGPWTHARRDRILRSRVETTRALVALIDRLRHKPAVLVSGSAVGWYGPCDDSPLTETAPQGDGFAARVCAAWEAEAMTARDLGVRVVTLRTGLVLGTEGGLLARVLTPFEFCLGLRFGDGRQWMSWIGRDDLVRVIAFVIARSDIDGPVNATAPTPVTNAGFAAALARALHRPALLAAPAWALRLALGDLARETLLAGQRVLPARLQKAGFRFDAPELDPCLHRITGGFAAKPDGLKRPETRAA